MQNHRLRIRYQLSLSNSFPLRRKIGGIWAAAAICCWPIAVRAFVPTHSFGIRRTPTRAFAATNDVQTLRVSEIRQELEERRIDYADCFDKESLVKRLSDAREGKVQAPDNSDASDDSDEQEETTVAQSSSSSKKDDDASVVDNIDGVRKMRVKELRTEIASRGQRWAGLLEKEDLVQKVYELRREAAAFGPHVQPGTVVSLTSAQLAAEVAASKGIPLLVDFYATWCGPCQLVAPQVEAIAAERGVKLRVGKVDSDAEQEASSLYRVQGLPTLLLFDASGVEVDRIEGAMMKDELLTWIDSKV